MKKLLLAFLCISGAFGAPNVFAHSTSTSFLFIDVAAQRAKQLRRGALPRLERATTAVPHKLERVAMEEVKQGVIQYTLPTTEDVQRGRGRNE